MRGRLARGILANGYGQVVTIGGQVLSVPLLIGAWGASGYGTWVMLTALPTALSFIDGGLVLASGNAMTMAVARGAEGQAAALYRAVLRTVFRVLVVAACLAALAVVITPAAVLKGLGPLEPAVMRLVLALLIGVVLAGTVSTLPAAACRAGGLYARAVAASTTVRLAEMVAVLAAATAGWGLPGAAAAWFVARAAGAGWLHHMSRRRLPWIDDRRDPAPSLRPLRGPALASVAMPAGFSICLQGTTLAVGLALSPAAVALFAATRTLTRAGVQLSGLVNHALMPEMAWMAGRDDRGGMRSLARWNAVSCLVLLGLAWLGIVVVGPRILSAWTGGRLQPDPGLLALLASAGALHGLWLGQANMLLAVNRQGEFAWLFLLTSVATVLLAWPTARSFGLHGVGVLTLFGELAMVVRLWLPRARPSPVVFAVEGGAS